MGSRYMANNIGDKIEPCGTPCLSLYGIDIVVFILMEKVLSCVYVCMYVCVYVSM